MNILSQITQITQTNAAGLHYIAEKRQVVASEVIGVIVVLGFVCDNLRDLRENRPFTCKGRARNEQGKSKERTSMYPHSFVA